MKLLEPEHRCIKCKTPLSFACNYIRSEEEQIGFVKKNSFWKCLFNKAEILIDTNKQYWSCPKCFEEYLINIGVEK